MPTATDLVTDLPADFEVFGQAVATSMADLLGGTSGQILAKNSNTDMDFVWIANDQGDITGITATSPLTGGGTSGAVTVGIQDGTTAQKGAVQLENSTSSTSTTTAAVPASVKSAYDLADGAIAKTTVTTAGDIIYRNATVPTRLGIGTANQVLRVNSGATAPEWATVSAGSLTKIKTVTFSGVTSTTTSFDGVWTSTYKNYMIVFSNLSGQASQGLLFALRNAGSTIGTQGFNGARLDNATVNAFSGNSAAITVLQVAGTTGSSTMIVNRSQSPMSGHFHGFNRLSVSSTTGAWMTDNVNADGADGFILSAAAGNIAGTVTVYGLEN